MFTDCDMTSWTQGPPVLVGEQTLWLGSGSGIPKSGLIKWIGHVPEIGHDWTVGIELVSIYSENVYWKLYIYSTLY